MFTIVKQNTEDRDDLVHSLLEKYVDSKTEKEKTKALQELNNNNCVLVDNDSNIQNVKNEIIEIFKQNQKKCYNIPDKYTKQLYGDKVIDVIINDINNAPILFDKDNNIYYILHNSSSKTIFLRFKVQNENCTYFSFYSNLILDKKNTYPLSLCQCIIKENGSIYYKEKIINQSIDEEEISFTDELIKCVKFVHNSSYFKETDKSFDHEVSKNVIQPLIEEIQNSNIKNTKYYEARGILFESVEYENGYIMNIFVAEHEKYGNDVYYAIVDDTENNYMTMCECLQLNDSNNTFELKMFLFEIYYQV